MAHAEVLLAIDEVDPGHPQRASVLNTLTSHLQALVPLQSRSDGRWH